MSLESTGSHKPNLDTLLWLLLLPFSIPHSVITQPLTIPIIIFDDSIFFVTCTIVNILQN